MSDEILFWILFGFIVFFVFYVMSVFFAHRARDRMVLSLAHLINESDEASALIAEYVPNYAEEPVREMVLERARETGGAVERQVERRLRGSQSHDYLSLLVQDAKHQACQLAAPRQVDNEDLN